MYGGCALDMLKPISATPLPGDFTEFFGDDSTVGVVAYTSACPTGHLLSGLTVSWSDWERYAGVPVIPVQVALQCRKAVGKCARA